MVISTCKCRVSNGSGKGKQMREGLPFLEDFPILSVDFTAAECCSSKIKN